MYPAGPPRIVISCVHWMIEIPTLFPATTPRICVATLIAGNRVWRMRPVRGPNFLTVQPVTKRLNVPQRLVLMPRMENCVATLAATWFILHLSPSPRYGG